MSLFNILDSGVLREAMKSLSGEVRGAAGNIRDMTPGGMGGLLGAGALGALLGQVLPKGALRTAGLAGIGAVAWNFYKKWSAQQAASAQQGHAAQSGRSGTTAGNSAAGLAVDPTAVLILRAMVFAAKADGRIDDTERTRIATLLSQLYPGQDVSPIVRQLAEETVNPALLARQVRSREQGEDLYRLSCLIIDVDQFMERSYLDGLAQELNLSASAQKALEQEAAEAKRQLGAMA